MLVGASMRHVTVTSVDPAARSTSSASGMTATVAVDVWIRAKGAMWTPLHDLEPGPSGSPQPPIRVQLTEAPTAKLVEGIVSSPTGEPFAAAMVHLAASSPHLDYACDTHYPWKSQDLVASGALEFVDGAVAFWSINRSHQSDIGGSTHGAYNPAATEIWQEGLRITPLKLYDAGALRDDVMRMIATNVRHPHDFLGDLRAMIGSARLGERRLLALLDAHGPKTVAAAVEEILDGAERQARACVRAWRDGVYRGETRLDDDGHGARDIPIRATVTKKGDGLVIDLSESAPQVTGFVNSAFPNTMSAVHMAFAYLIDPRTPKNEGTFRPVTVKARPGTIVCPHPPAPVTLCTNHCGQEIIEAIKTSADVVVSTVTG